MTKQTRKWNKDAARMIQRSLRRLLVNGVNRIDFVELAGKIARSESGRPFLDRFENLPEAWENASDISRLAVDLTVAQMEADGDRVDRTEIRNLIREIDFRYNRRIHVDCASALGLAFDHLFEHQSPDIPFTSPDGRDLRHLDQLKAHRDRGLGVVYLINHSSHLDEFLLDVLWQHLGMGLPVFAAGQNMMTVKSVARVLMTGSYVVIRQGAGRLRMAALANYCSALSRCGAQQGIFLEAWRGGARTRDGGLRYPKRLITLQGAIDVADDVVVQPVAISYSAVPEDLMMCSRKGARSWTRGLGFFRTLSKAPFHGRSFLWEAARNLYGRAYISIPPPMLLSELRETHRADKSGITLDEFVSLTAIREIARTKKIMSSQLTARALTAARKKGSGDLAAAVICEMNAIREYHLAAFGEEPDFEDFIRNRNAGDIAADGLAMLKRRGVLRRFRKDTAGLPGVLDPVALSYYANHGDRRLYSPTADQNIVVVGAGTWGFALSHLIGNRLLEDKKFNNASITIFDARADVVEHMGLHRSGPGRFENELLPKNVFVTGDHPSAFRKASEIVMASKPEDLERHVRWVLETSEQPLKVILATRGFVPGMKCLPFRTVERLVNEYKRTDVDILVLAGPVTPEDLVGAGPIQGVLADAGGLAREMGDLFTRPSVNLSLSMDPVGVQAADILARVYAVWVNFMETSGRFTHPSQIAFLMADASREVGRLAVALGASPGTFAAGSIPWNAAFIAVCLRGPWRDFGRQAGLSAKKGKDPKRIIEKMERQWISEGYRLHALTDIREALAIASDLGIDMPVLSEMDETFYGVEQNETD